MSSRTLVIDARLLQTPTWLRGMGRYLLGVLTGLATQPGSLRIILLFSDEFETDAEKIEVIKRACPRAEVVTLPIAKGGTDSVRKKNAQIVDRYLESQGIEGATFLQASLFTFDYFPFYPTQTKNTCIFYDIIPIKNWEIFSSYFPAHEYFSRFKALYEADMIFSISNTVKEDLIEYLGFSEDEVVSIDGADAPDIFHETIEVSEESPRDYRYILLPGGDAPHKNILRAIRGFDIFNAQFGDVYRLIITSFYSANNTRRMLELSPNIELSGQISDKELRDLYTHADMVLFPSLDEGLGMPILEAVNYGQKVACSAIPIFKEISSNAFYFFDPYSPEDIARALQESLEDNDVESRKKKYQDIQARFTWKRSADVLLSAQVKKVSVKRDQRRSIVVEQDGSEKLTKLVGQLVRQAYREKDVDLYIDALDEKVDSEGAPLIFNHVLMTRDISDAFKKASKNDRVIIYTKKSRYTKAVERSEDEIIYSGVKAETVAKTFKESFGDIS